MKILTLKKIKDLIEVVGGYSIVLGIGITCLACIAGGVALMLGLRPTAEGAMAVLGAGIAYLGWILTLSRAHALVKFFMKNAE